MHIKTSQAHPGAPGKDEGSSLRAMNGSGHGYSLSTYYVHNLIVYHNKNQSVNIWSKEIIY